ncbi:hypothetical protein G7B40_020165 [Aetokthonos hydrillicola Thurmond2011]|uniref:Uncharacterized protein n=1 Tax=Aetokthonos hydrillicola Thurmond2011 TaxID=2712845 RepID=A0AAP5IB44_9CYAN|nr:hypothetical protein [Aetokthonos hydrillicola]MBO3459685.1 hypothetical protein [Aetokthonos hydrillicola CCALA 1050]MBW4588535.1 hypothetical protein [Aetokthonos hydrillicola CCALA 1050]MDR9896862.1 hypothetical protein [Aetokthonos hydrillicola Thurmond2011]
MAESYLETQQQGLPEMINRILKLISSSLKSFLQSTDSFRPLVVSS